MWAAMSLSTAYDSTLSSSMPASLTTRCRWPAWLQTSPPAHKMAGSTSPGRCCAAARISGTTACHSRSRTWPTAAGSPKSRARTGSGSTTGW